jgi:hypothetical protein
MTILRVLLVASPVANEALAWGLFDAAGACVRTGRSIASEWPPADRVEAVLAASQVRIASVALPPLAPARVAAAAGFAVDDQLNGTKEARHLRFAPGARRRCACLRRARSSQGCRTRLRALCADHRTRSRALSRLALVRRDA